MNDFDYSKEDIIKALSDVGIVENDNIFIHSNIGFFGILKDAKNRNDYYEIFKKAIFEIIGQGTLVVPTFSYSFCWNKVFDKENTPSTCGFLTDMVLDDKDSLRSDDANFSISAIGGQAENLTKHASEYSFGKDSFWERFLKVNGKICNFNFDAGSTFFHYVERELNVSYRKDKRFDGFTSVGGKLQKKSFYHYCRDLNVPNFYPDNTKFDNKAREMGFVKTSNLGRGQILSITVKDTFDLIKAEYKKDPCFLIQGC